MKFTSTIKSCLSSKNLNLGKSIHAHITKSGSLPDTSLSNHLLNVYSKLSTSISDAGKLFDEMPNRDLVSFSILISASVRSGRPKSGLILVKELGNTGITPNHFVFSSAAVACSKLVGGDRNVSLWGKQVHAQVVTLGYEDDNFVKASLIDMYSKFGDLGSVVSVFISGEVVIDDPVVFNSMITGYVAMDCNEEAVDLFAAARRRLGFNLTEPCFIGVIKACGCLESVVVGESVHGLVVRIGLDFNSFIGTSLIDMYGRHGYTEKMEVVFKTIITSGVVDVAAFNVMLVGYSTNCAYEDSVGCFRELLHGRKLYGQPDDCTLSTVLKACGGLKSVELGRAIHGLVEKTRFSNRLVVQTALIDMYFKCRMIVESTAIFVRMEARNVVLYNSMIFGLSQNGMVSEAFKLFDEMTSTHNLKPDLATFIALNSCLPISPGSEWIVYAQAIKHGFGGVLMFENSLLDALLNTGKSEEALEFFNQMESKNVISWTSVISGLTQLGFHSKAIEVFNGSKSNVAPNNFTFSSVFKACGSSLDLHAGRSIHAHGIKHSVATWDMATQSSILDMYAKCGAFVDSHKIFEEMPKNDTISWNAMISAYAHHGFGREAVKQYTMMEEESNTIEPNSTTFASLLKACSHCGLVEDGVRLFELMITKHKIVPSSLHYGSMVDMFGRAGMLSTAKFFIEKIPPPEEDSSIWTMFLSACKLHGNTELVQGIAERHILANTSTKHASPGLVLLSNIYSGDGNWTDAEKTRQKLKDSGINKEVGLTWVIHTSI